MVHPILIQGGMGAGVSNWKLARAVAKLGHLGVVSGTALDVILSRRLQDGDPTGELREALEKFPVAGVAQRVLQQHFVPGGKPKDRPYKGIPLPCHNPSPASVELIVAANFVEVHLAKQGHGGPVGINYLHKIQMPTLPSLFGAMLAGVDYVLMGAGIPMAIPGIIDQLALGHAVKAKLEVEGAGPEDIFEASFDPAAFCGGQAPVLRRPYFLAIISSTVLALTLARKASGRVDGFIVEGDTAGGHNAPPRGAKQRNARGEPIYGPRDLPDLEKIRELGLPFWLAGSFASRERLEAALKTGATGVQVGTAFAFCEESGIDPKLKSQVIAAARSGTLDVFTDPLASPTGFPFKVALLEGTISDPAEYAARERICDLGYLRHAYRRPDGTLGYRCPGEPEENFVKKGGALEETTSRKCVCNGLLATIGLGQVLPAGHELALVTAGDDALHLARFLSADRDSYTAADVAAQLLR